MNPTLERGKPPASGSSHTIESPLASWNLPLASAVFKTTGNTTEEMCFPNGHAMSKHTTPRVYYTTIEYTSPV